MVETLPVLQLGHPDLRQPAQPVLDVQAPSVQCLINNLLQTLVQRGGVGIAAPQVGIPYQLLIVASHPTVRYPRAPLMQPEVMINPQILGHSEQQEQDWEGCLSVPGLRGRVSRYQEVAIAYLDRQGTPRTLELQDFIARIFQHEYDHLNGLLFIDRVTSTLDLFTEQEYQRQVMGASNLHPLQDRNAQQGES